MNRARWVGPGRLVATALAATGLVTWATLSPAAPQGTSDQRPGGGSTLAAVTSASASCPGPELSGVDSVDDIDVAARIGAATAPEEVLGALDLGAPGRLVLRSGDDESSPVDARGVTTTEDATSGVSTEVLATGRMAPGLAAGQEWSVDRDEIRGLSTVSCAGPGSDLWLLAGGGDPGRQERLVLSNPGANEVTVDLQVLGRRGPVPSPTGATVVPARGRVALLVDAISGAEESPALRVRVNGGAVHAVMSDMWLDGSVPAGAETTGPTAEPSTTQVIPAYVTGTSGSLRVAVPGDQQAVVSAQVVGPDGVSPLPGGVLRVPARSTGELAVKGLAPGRYALRVTADVPVVASMFSAWRYDGKPGDFTWSASAPAASGLLGAAFPEGVRAGRSLVVSSVRGPATVSVTWGAKGRWTTKAVTLSQDTSATVDLGEATAVWVRRDSGRGEVRAGVATMGGGAGSRLVSVVPLADSAVTSAVSRAHPAP